MLHTAMSYNYFEMGLFCVEKNMDHIQADFHKNSLQMGVK